MGREKRPISLDSISDLAQVAAALEAGTIARDLFRRPEKGWLRSVRQLYAMNLNEIATRRDVAPQVLLRAEVAEMQDRITLRNLRAIADAMGFDLFYSLIPRDSSARNALDARISEAVREGFLPEPQAEMVRMLVRNPSLESRS